MKETISKLKQVLEQLNMETLTSETLTSETLTSETIRLKKELVAWEWYEDVPVKTLLIHLLLTVSDEGFKYKGRSVPVNSTVTTVAKLSENTGLSVSQTRLAIKKLEAIDCIRTNATNFFTVITINDISQFITKINES